MEAEKSCGGGKGKKTKRKTTKTRKKKGGEEGGGGGGGEKTKRKSGAETRNRNRNNNINRNKNKTAENETDDAAAGGDKGDDAGAPPASTSQPTSPVKLPRLWTGDSASDKRPTSGRAPSAHVPFRAISVGAGDAVGVPLPRSSPLPSLHRKPTQAASRVGAVDELSGVRWGSSASAARLCSGGAIRFPSHFESGSSVGFDGSEFGSVNSIDGSNTGAGFRAAVETNDAASFGSIDGGADFDRGKFRQGQTATKSRSRVSASSVNPTMPVVGVDSWKQHQQQQQQQQRHRRQQQRRSSARLTLPPIVESRREAEEDEEAESSANDDGDDERDDDDDDDDDDDVDDVDDDENGSKMMEKILIPSAEEIAAEMEAAERKMNDINKRQDAIRGGSRGGAGSGDGGVGSGGGSGSGEEEKKKKKKSLEEILELLSIPVGSI